MPDINAIKTYLLQLQTSICQTLAKEDGQKQFQEDVWERPDGGHGRTHVLENGAVIEKCGVNFSHIRGKQLPPAATTLYPELAGGSFQAMGISVIVHPRNPYAPTTHMNVRFFIAEKPNMQPVWWFGGGFDLTPYYGFTEDCVHWHQMAKQACAPFGADLYPIYKKAADDYFYLKHRQEGRGIGGIFFDNVNQPDFPHAFAFMRSVGDHFMPAYQPLLAHRKHQAYGEREREFQLYRRGRYVEFNLIYDRGTVFGLQFGGRIESILVSLPSPVTWHYNWQPEPNTDEARLYTEFLVPRDWV